jgi:hypothetical protein
MADTSKTDTPKGKRRGSSGSNSPAKAITEPEVDKVARFLQKVSEECDMNHEEMRDIKSLTVYACIMASTKANDILDQSDPRVFQVLRSEVAKRMRNSPEGIFKIKRSEYEKIHPTSRDAIAERYGNDVLLEAGWEGEELSFLQEDESGEKAEEEEEEEKEEKEGKKEETVEEEEQISQEKSKMRRPEVNHALVEEMLESGKDLKQNWKDRAEGFKEIAELMNQGSAVCIDLEYVLPLTVKSKKAFKEHLRCLSESKSSNDGKLKAYKMMIGVICSMAAPLKEEEIEKTEVDKYLNNLSSIKNMPAEENGWKPMTRLMCYAQEKSSSKRFELVRSALSSLEKADYNVQKMEKLKKWKELIEIGKKEREVAKYTQKIRAKS